MSLLTNAALTSAEPQYGTFVYGAIVPGASSSWYQTLAPYPAIPAGYQFPTYDQIETMILNIEANSVTALAAATAVYGTFVSGGTFPISVQTSYHATPQTYNLYLAPNP